MFLHLHYTRQLLPAQLAVRPLSLLRHRDHVKLALAVRVKFDLRLGLVLAHAAVEGRTVELGWPDVILEQVLYGVFETLADDVLLRFLLFGAFTLLLMCFIRFFGVIRSGIYTLQLSPFVLRKCTLGQGLDSLIGKVGEAYYPFCIIIGKRILL